MDIRKRMKRMKSKTKKFIRKNYPKVKKFAKNFLFGAKNLAVNLFFRGKKLIKKLFFKAKVFIRTFPSKAKIFIKTFPGKVKRFIINFPTNAKNFILNFPANTRKFFKKLKRKLRRRKLKHYLLPGLMLLFSATFLVCAGILAKTALDYRTQAKQNQQLANMVQQAQAQAPVQRPPISLDGSHDYEEPLSAFTEIAHPITGQPIRVLREYAPVYQLNSDMVGWITLPGTKINYPVMQTPSDPDFYLKRDFYKKSSRNGTIYAHAWADLHAPSDNVTLYGHNMRDGSMFAALHKYESKEFYDANPYIYFDTLYEHRTYQVIAAFQIDITEVTFEYHNLVKGNTISFRDYMDMCKEYSFYKTGVTASYGDKLLTLSTCDMDTSTDDIRFVIVAKLVT